MPVPANAIIVKYTWMGDMDLDGKVTVNDYVEFLHYYTQKPTADTTTFMTGDCNYDGKINVNDYLMLLAGTVPSPARSPPRKSLRRPRPKPLSPRLEAAAPAVDPAAPAAEPAAELAVAAPVASAETVPAATSEPAVPVTVEAAAPAPVVVPVAVEVAAPAPAAVAVAPETDSIADQLRKSGGSAWLTAEGTAPVTSADESQAELAVRPAQVDADAATAPVLTVSPASENTAVLKV